MQRWVVKMALPKVSNRLAGGKARPDTLKKTLGAAARRNNVGATSSAARRLLSSGSQEIVLKQWPTPMVETRGDYRDEAFLEEYIGGPLYSNQEKMPTLPVPSIQETLERFLPTALPLARTDEEAQALQSAVEKFPEQAQVLQERLEQRAADMSKGTTSTTKSSWLQHWWNTLGYLQFRDSIVINVSYFFHFADDPTLPIGDPDAWLYRAATLLTGLAEFRQGICSGQMPADVIPGRRGKPDTPLCATAFKYMFHACRVPQTDGHDTVRLYDPSRYTHCIVAYKGQFFAVDYCQPETGNVLPISVLKERLAECVRLAESSNKNLELGWFTSGQRDDWARNRTALMQLPGMDQAMEVLEAGAFVISLDDESLVSRQECSEYFLHGGANAAKNRWFDKSIHVACMRNGRAGIIGEHSMMDGMPVVKVADAITKYTFRDVESRPENQTAAAAPGGVQSIFQNVWDTNDTTKAEALVAEAKQKHMDFISANSIHVQSFQGYGSSYIKKAGFSPDAFVQMAIQLAGYRLFGEPVGTYESTQVRTFLHGRTETTRSVSTASAAFCEMMGLRPKRDEHDADIRKQKVDLLTQAVTTHVQYIGNAAKARGVDRHFFGLSMLVEDGETKPDLLADPVFDRSKRWRLSTSHLSHPQFVNWGFGHVVPDGLGVSYSIHPEHSVFNVCGLKETGWTDAMAELLEESLVEMKTLVQLEQQETPQSKL